MNTPFESEAGQSAPESHRRLRAGARVIVTRSSALFLILTLGAGVTGCSFLKPARPTARHFVLTPLPFAGPASAPGHSLSVGLGPVRLPAYLFNTSMAVRHGTNEVNYLSSALWAERLDKGFQSVLAANLSVLRPTDQIRLAPWNREDISAEVYVAVEQFDVDARGQGTLVVRWRIAGPGGEKTLKSGQSRLSHQGPAPEADPSGAVATLSRLLAEFSRELARALGEVMTFADSGVTVANGRALRVGAARR